MKIRAIFRLIAFVWGCFYYGTKGFLCKLVNYGGDQIILTIFQEWAAYQIKILGIKLQVEGAFPQQPALILANHRSYIDIVFFPFLTRCTIVSKKEVASWPAVGYGARAASCIFVDRSDPDSRKNTRLAIVDRLSKGISVAVFPEGTTSAGPGMLEIKRGMVNSAAQGAIPIIPVALAYVKPDDCWIGDDTFLPHFLRVFARKSIVVNLTIGNPMIDEGFDNLHTRLVEWWEKHLQKLDSV